MYLKNTVTPMVEKSAFLSELSSRIEENMNEETICTRVIVPYLQHIGWKPKQIHAEWKVANESNKAVDYALGSESDPDILIEAKALKEDPLDNIDQLSVYLKLSETTYGIITNGVKYVLLKYSESEINIIQSYTIEDSPPKEILPSKKEEEKKLSEISLNKFYKNLPTGISSNCMKSLVAQYQSSFEPLTPLDINLCIDLSVLDSYRKFFKENYKNSLYIKLEGSKKEIIRSEPDPNLVIIDSADLNCKLGPSQLKNNILSLEKDPFSGIPKNKPLIILNTPQYDCWDRYEPREDQLVLENSLYNYIDLIFIIGSPTNPLDEEEYTYDLDESTLKFIKELNLDKKPTVNPNIENSEKISDFISNITKQLNYRDAYHPVDSRKRLINSMYPLTQAFSNMSDFDINKSIEEAKEIVLETHESRKIGSEGDFNDDWSEGTSGSGTSASQRQVMDSIVDLLEEMADEYDDNGYVPREDLIPAVVSETGRESSYIEQRLDGIEARDGGDMFMTKKKPKRYKSI
jgi:hypothetical protein